MATVLFNVGKGRSVELYRNVGSGIRPNGAFVIVILKAQEPDATLIDRLTLAEVLANVNTLEADFTNYVREQMGSGVIGSLPDPDIINDEYVLTFPDITYNNAGGANNNNLMKLLLCYADDTTAVVDADIVPIIAFDYAVTTDGTSLLVEFPVDAFSAS